MRTIDDPVCPFELTVTHREHEALEWLLRVCKNISENPKSCNRLKASLAAIVIEKMRDQLNDNHALLHELEVTVAKQAHQLAANEMFTYMAKNSSTEGTN